MAEFSNMPISKIVYGEDHPKFQTPPSGPPREPNYPGTKIALLVPQRNREALLGLGKKLLPGTRKLLS